MNVTTNCEIICRIMTDIKENISITAMTVEHEESEEDKKCIEDLTHDEAQKECAKLGLVSEGENISKAFCIIKLVEFLGQQGLSTNSFKFSPNGNTIFPGHPYNIVIYILILYSFFLDRSLLLYTMSFHTI